MTDTQNKTISTLDKLIAEFFESHRKKSFAQRNPHLGKMINCHVCGNRHFSSKVCKLVYATHDRHGDPYYEDGSPMITPLPDQMTTPTSTRNSILGAAMFAKKRLRPHRKPPAKVRAYEARMKLLGERFVRAGLAKAPEVPAEESK